MIQLGKSNGLFVKALARNFVAERPRIQYLDGHFAIEVFVAGAINHTHSALANLLDQAVVTEWLTNERVLAQRLRCHGKTFLPLTL